MKRLLLVLACVFMVAAPAGAVDFDALYLWGQDYNAWMTEDYGFPYWILGVSLDWNGALVQAVGSKSLPGPFGDGVYYLYAANQEQNNLGNQYGYVRLRLYQGVETYDVYFTKPATPGPGTFALWAEGPYAPIKSAGFNGTPTIYFGWAEGTADKVQNLSDNTGSGDSKADWFMVLGVNVEPTCVIPIPGAVWLLGSGLAGVLGLRRWRRH